MRCVNIDRIHGPWTQVAMRIRRTSMSARSRPLIAAVGEQLRQERILPEQSGKKQDAAVTILDIGGGNNRVEQQAQRIYEKVALLALDLLARIIAMRIDPGPPFSALLTLWLSMMAAVGLASRSPCSRHSKYSA